MTIQKVVMMKKFPLLGMILVLLVISPLAAQDGGDPKGPDPASLKGLIAYIGDDHNVYTIDPATQAITALTDDATQTERYQWPTWATDNQLAYFCCDVNFATEVVADVYVSPDGVVAGERAYSGANQIMTYAYWSPGDCGTDCRELAVLLGGTGEFDVQIIQRNDAGFSDRLLGSGAPFYISWSPDGARMLLQRGNARYDVYDVLGDTFNPIDAAPGFIQAPQWSPVDDRLLIGTLNQETFLTDIVVIENGEARTLVADLDGLVSFNWSPDGNAIAYRTVRDEFNDLTVIDAVSGDVIAGTRSSEVIAFFWSPDSSRIAYVTPGTLRGAISDAVYLQDNALAWWLLDVDDDRVRRYSSFAPTNEMLYLLTYFDQFAQSHSVWSPDSTHIVFVEQISAQNAVVSLLDMTQPDAVPFAVADGVIAIWSYE